MLISLVTPDRVTSSHWLYTARAVYVFIVSCSCVVLISEGVHKRHSKQMTKDMQGRHHEYMHTLFKSSVSLASLLQTIPNQVEKKMSVSIPVLTWKKETVFANKVVGLF